ncbi:prephenate dehydrogenase [Ekhidna sp. MALMAid0563]|uniref:prephenate dehydrogenase n=1 Tax=Ekhidna sp. MALMAid0563 TaxID=3143937 RepID=UPI0032DF0843
MNILLVGVGLIGGSFSLALKHRKDLIFGGYDKSEDAQDKALELGIVSHGFPTLSEGIQWADIIIVSVPVRTIRELLPEILDQVQPHHVVVDFGSTKEAICASVSHHPNRKQFIAAHPIAGTEHSGPSAAFGELYKEMNLILCDTNLTEQSKLKEFEVLAKDAGFSIIHMDSREHDTHLAYISHLSHITSFALSCAVLQKEKDGEVILGLAGSGFASTVRLAKSSPSMWSSIFMENKEMVLKGIEAYKDELEKLKSLIEKNQEEALEKYLEGGREIRRILD